MNASTPSSGPLPSLLRKVVTATRILRRPSGATQLLRERWRFNLLHARFALSREGWFAYRTNVGTRFIADRADPATFFIFTSGHPDTAELNVLDCWLNPGDYCVDLGANVGFFAAHMATRIGPSGLVCAVEASPATFATLQRIISRLQLPQVAVRHGCAGATTGTTTFYVANDPNLSPLQSVVAPGVAGEFAPVTVAQFRADDCARHIASERRVALVKIDVEGAESDALTGCQRLLDCDDPPLFAVEINPAALVRNRSSPAGVLRPFAPDRYELLFINAAPAHDHALPFNRLAALNRSDVDHLPPLGNLIAVPRVGAFAPRRTRLQVSA